MSRTLNPWRELQGLLPAEALLVVEVIEHHLDGIASTVQLPGGQQFKARGQSVAEGAFAFVRAGEIRGEAPSVTPATLDV